MLINITLLFLFAGIPYYLLFEKTKMISHEKIFFLSVMLVLTGMYVAYSYPHEFGTPFVIVSLLSAVFSFYKASRTTNFYKFAYYLLFVNAPILILFSLEQSALYFIALILTLMGVYSIAKHYEKNYGSANYHSVTGVIVITPFVGGFLSIYLITLALYPPFPSALFFLHTIFVADISVLWYVVVLFIFFANFILAMRVMGKTVFGKPNGKIHYVDLTRGEKTVHFLIFILLFILTIWEFKEIFK
ncbi:MAG: hypothetical protein Q9M36_13610 [Sulfurovum sp.]|nr:hypothetical protein [Sulfurovum sp.]